ncbi:MAG TPA: prolipoprotein diacylglyceryl transferase family protein [Gemmatimonadaceae bacterium]|nr:prolipoprotein diacylglyceryl transferase family protein [Gemmatimonadaceae bacterium]
MTSADVAKRLLYGATFVVGVPLLLVMWAIASAPMVTLPRIGNPVAGGVLAMLGALLLSSGMVALIRHGQGLPMNAFPPERLVREGVYRWIRNPIYIGFGLVVLGESLAARSASGLWLVTPAIWLAMAALVFGYERHDLRGRFGQEAVVKPLFALPRADDAPPTPIERVATLTWTFIPWLAAYYAVQALGQPPDAFSTMLPGELRWPVLPWMELPYTSAYVVVPTTVLVVQTRRALRDFATSGIAGTVVITLCWLAIPVVAVHRVFDRTGASGALLWSEQSHSANVAAFPAFHVLWPMLAARAWSIGRGRLARWLVWSWAALVALSCVATGHHSLIDVAAGAALYPPLRDLGRTWDVARRAAEQLANSWREWRAGPVRFINYGLYAGAAAAVGLTIAGAAAGPGREMSVVWVGMWVLIGAGAYAQVLEGSSRLLRPFGWYGGVIGALIGIFTSPFVGGAVVPLLAAFALAAPWVQILGRLRCLVQGCCHGGPAPARVGICYQHQRSRVTQIAHLSGVPLHPTPVYSIAGNIVIGLLLVRLRMLSCPDSLLLGVYLMLSGCARFVEESYRGEPQTPLVLGLRLYQWFAIGTLFAGMLSTMIPMPRSGRSFSVPSPGLLAWALVMFLVFAAAMGLDFPRSNRRFSRLAAVDN